jgi:hypothetical protein
MRTMAVDAGEQRSPRPQRRRSWPVAYSSAAAPSTAPAYEADTARRFSQFVRYLAARAASWITKQVFRIVVLRRRREIEAAGDYDGAVDHHDLVVRDPNRRVDPDRDAGVAEVGRRAIAGTRPAGPRRGLVA